MNFFLQGRKYSPQDLISEASSSYLPQFLGPVIRFLEFWFSDKPHFEASTSGSTSAPKSVLISRKKIQASAAMTLAFLKADSSTDGFILCLPADKAGGFMVLARALQGNLDVLLLEPTLSPFGLFPLFADKRQWLVSLVPPQLDSVLDSDQFISASRNWKGILLGGAAIPRKTIYRVRSLNCPVYHTFGMTETVSHFAVRKIWDPSDVSFQPEAPYVLLPGMDMQISENQTLLVRGPVTEMEWTDTGDVAERAVGRTDAFYFLGRRDEVINSGGLKIHPDAVRKSWEQAFPRWQANPVFMGLEDEKWGWKLVMVLANSEIQGFPPEAFMADWAKSEDPKKLPKSVYCIPEIPRTSTMKTNIQALRTLLTGMNPVWEKK